MIPPCPEPRVRVLTQYATGDMGILEGDPGVVNAGRIGLDRFPLRSPTVHTNPKRERGGPCPLAGTPPTKDGPRRPLPRSRFGLI
jgi:hypothetical protein